MKGGVADIKQHLKDQADAGRVEQMWQDSIGIASSLRQIGVLTNNTDLVTFGGVAEHVVQTSKLSSVLSAALKGAITPDKLLSAASSGIGLIVLGVQLAGMFGEPQKDPVIEMLDGIYRQINENHVEVMNKLDVLEENQLRILNKVSQVFSEIKVNHIEIKEYLANHFHGVHQKLDNLAKKADD